MLQDLAAIAPPLIICVAFLVGVGALLRHEMAPRRRGGSATGPGGAQGARQEGLEGEEDELGRTGGS